MFIVPSITEFIKMKLEVVAVAAVLDKMRGGVIVGNIDICILGLEYM